MASAINHSRAILFVQASRQSGSVAAVLSSKVQASQAHLSKSGRASSTVNPLTRRQSDAIVPQRKGIRSSGHDHYQKRPITTQQNTSTSTSTSTNTTTPPSRQQQQQQTYPKGIFSAGRPPTEIHLQPHGPSIWTALKSVFGLTSTKPAAPTYVPAPFTSTNNPFRARKRWPPNFKQLHPKHQFHFEKTYRRRMKLKYARPRWTKATKIVQYVLICGTVVYWVFFLDMEDTGTPFDNFRVWFFDKIRNLGNLPEQSREEASRLTKPRPKTKDAS